VLLGVLGGAGEASAHESERTVLVLSPDYRTGGVSEACWSALLKAGYKGRDDGADVLYVPARVLNRICD
jgi:hypothetical protein